MRNGLGSTLTTIVSIAPVVSFGTILSDAYTVPCRATQSPIHAVAICERP